MDIVDINKVLDDLELNEEEHSKLSKPTSVGSDENRSASKQYVYGPTSAATITGPSATATSTANRMTKTNFVKVSNVFNR